MEGSALSARALRTPEKKQNNSHLMKKRIERAHQQLEKPQCDFSRKSFSVPFYSDCEAWSGVKNEQNNYKTTNEQIQRFSQK